MDHAFWKNRRVFVTGPTGFLGSWLVSELVNLGAEVVGLIRDWVPQANLFYSGNYPKIMSVRGDLTDEHLLERILNEYEVDTVFHVGAQAIVPIANRGPLSTFESNIRGTWCLLEACRRSPWVKRIVVASSDKAYGENPQLPYYETMPLLGLHPYDVSKSCADLLCQAYAATYQLPVCVTRCGNFYGGGDLNMNRIVPGTIRSVLHNESPIIRSDGTLVRDYFYIEDAVAAYQLVAEKMETLKLFGQAFNFSNEAPVKVTEIVQKILTLMETTLAPVILNEATNEIKAQYLSATKAHSTLGWKPLFDLDRGLRHTIAWYRAYFTARTPSQVEIQSPHAVDTIPAHDILSLGP